MSIDRWRSFGGYPRVVDQRVVPVWWRDDPLPKVAAPVTLLPRGRGLSYGDVCLNEGGTLLWTGPLDRFIAFDPEAGVVRCEAGVTIAQLATALLPRGWFLPVSPGTALVSLGGAVANDVHGKNQHRRGCFGRYVRALELARSDGSRSECTPTRNAELFRATIGGMGLTGLITAVELQLLAVCGPTLELESQRLTGLADLFAHGAETQRHEYAVAWIDASAPLRHLGRGVLYRAEHSREPAALAPRAGEFGRARARVPCLLPSGLARRSTLSLLNRAYGWRAGRSRPPRLVSMRSFLFPLDSIGDWNRVYGRRGVLQYQCVVPLADAQLASRELLLRIGRSGTTSFLTVAKLFGTLDSPGLMSFPRAGMTWSFDFPLCAEALRLCDELDRTVAAAGGRLYPAKDARMSGAMFRAGFPEWTQFAAYIDPLFSSSFWRRVTRGEESTR